MRWGGVCLHFTNASQVRVLSLSKHLVEWNVCGYEIDVSVSYILSI